MLFGKREYPVSKWADIITLTDAKMIARLSEDLGEAMVGINESEIQLLMAERGK